MRATRGKHLPGKNGSSEKLQKVHRSVVDKDHQPQVQLCVRNVLPLASSFMLISLLHSSILFLFAWSFGLKEASFEDIYVFHALIAVKSSLTMSMISFKQKHSQENI